MAVTRADTLTATIKKRELYSDFVDSFAKSPFSGQLSLVKNEKSVSQSLKNLIYTSFGERLFNPNFGSDVNSMLFELNTENDLNILKYKIKQAILLHEPRVQLINIEVALNTQTDFQRSIMTNDIAAYKTVGGGEQSVEVTIVFTTINNTTPITLNFILKRVR